PTSYPATLRIYTLSLHDALPISLVSAPAGRPPHRVPEGLVAFARRAVAERVERLELKDLVGSRVRANYVVHREHFHGVAPAHVRDRKSTRLNSSHRTNSYAVFCL